MTSETPAPMGEPAFSNPAGGADTKLMFVKRALLPIALLLFVSCRIVPSTVSDRLFCGLSTADGGTVSDAEVEAFLTEVVEPRFPDGFTVWRARGAWQGGREETLVIEIVHPNEDSLDRRVAEIAETYRVRFRQQAVLRVTSPATMEFIDGDASSVAAPCNGNCAQDPQPFSEPPA